MRCPFCGAEDSSVLDSRPIEDGSTIRRRRSCADCKKRFTTYERRESGNLLTVVKKDGSREPFDRQKLLLGLSRATVKRPVSREELEKIINEVEAELLTQGESEINASLIGEKVLKKLKNIDLVAYIRFASVYKDFGDVYEFMEELKRLQEEGGN